jgi:hypothetical protein
MKVLDVLEGSLLFTTQGKEPKKADQARGDDPMPKKTKPTGGPEQKHPLQGKLVGG